MNILVVDDEERIRENFIKRLSQLPIKFDNYYQGKDGFEGLAIIQSKAVDIALIDINMPFLNGLELIQKLHTENAELSIVIISGYDNFAYAQEAIKYGVKAYLLKPVNRLEFAETIVSLCEEIDATDKQSLADQIITRMKQHISNSHFSLSDLATEMALSNGHLSKLIIHETGKTFGELLTGLRIDQAKHFLRELPYGTKMYEIAEMVGFNNQYYFSSVFKKQTGLSPKEFLKSAPAN